MHLIGPAVWLIYLVDHHNRMQVELQGLLEYKTRLRHRPFKGIHQQDYPVGHFQYPLYFSAEIRVTRGVDHIDFYIFIGNRSILTEYGDAPLTLQIVGVHDQITGFLVIPEYLGGMQDLVNQRGLTMVNVGNNGYISDFHNRTKKAKTRFTPV